ENSLPDLSKLPYFSEIKIGQFTTEEAETLISFKLSQLFSTYKLPKKLVSLVMNKSGGNPFFIEEILNFIKDLKVDVKDESSLESLDLPDTIYSLILSRVDRLSQRQQVALRVASVIGRLFRSAMVWGIYPGNVEKDIIFSDLQDLTKLEITTVEKPEPELTYLFRHIVTQEVTYESLPFNTRSHLHEQVGNYIESHYLENIDQFVDVLAFHYGRSKNRAKKKEYLIKAGDAAKESFSNSAAIDFYTQSLDLLEADESIQIQRKLGDVLQLIGEWEQAEQVFQELIEITHEEAYYEHYPQVLIDLGELKRKQGQYSDAEDYLNQSHSTALNLNDQKSIGKALLCKGTLNAQQGKFNEASTLYLDSLKIQQELEDDMNIANILNNLGIVSEYLGNIEQAKQWFEESFETCHRIGYTTGVANTSGNIANILLELGQPYEAIKYAQESLTIKRQVGDPWATANTLNNYGNAARETNQLEKAIDLYKESLEIYGELGDKWALSFLLEDIGILFAIQGIAKKSLFMVGVADKLREEINSPLSEVLKEKLDNKLKPAKEKLGEMVSKQAWSAGRKTKVEDAINIALDQLSRAAVVDTPDYDGAVAYALNLIRSDLDPKYVYHNIVHTADDVLPAAMRLAEIEDLSEEDKLLLKVAAAFHDVGYINGGAPEHEARSCDVVRDQLPLFGFDADQVESICATIMATKIPQTPTSLSGQILADADLDLLGRKDFPECSHRLRLELEELGSKLTDLEWFSQQIAFLSNHNYFTNAALKTRYNQKQENIEWLKNLVEELS
ncbi:MAG: tetratricopeptide repeat protein, partial [Chloroflexota bacterium]